MKWTKEQIEILTKSYQKLGVSKTAELLGLTNNSVRRKAELLNLSCELAKSKWTDQETNFLIENYNLLGASKCAELLKKSKTSIRSKASRLLISNFGDWTQAELETLNSLYSTTNSRKLSTILNRTPAAIKKKASELKIRGTAPGSYSAIAIEWLDSFNNPNILHAENGGEQFIAGYYVDGYDSVTNTVYEFHGDLFHGNLDIFKPSDTPNPFNKTISAETLWQKTYDRMEVISKKATVLFIWEKDYREGKMHERF